MIGRVALCISLVSAVLLVVLFAYMIVIHEGDEYLSSFQSLSYTRKMLFPLAAGSGLLIVGFSGIVTWLVGIYSSYRVAGPLFRFTANIEIDIDQKTPPLIRLRSSDTLQRETELLELAVLAVNTHYLKLADILKTMEDNLANQMSADDEEMQELLNRYREEHRRVQFDC
jgi:hypothetical protein